MSWQAIGGQKNISATGDLLKSVSRFSSKSCNCSCRCRFSRVLDLSSTHSTAVDFIPHSFIVGRNINSEQAVARYLCSPISERAVLVNITKVKLIWFTLLSSKNLSSKATRVYTLICAHEPKRYHTPRKIWRSWERAKSQFADEVSDEVSNGTMIIADYVQQFFDFLFDIARIPNRAANGNTVRASFQTSANRINAVDAANCVNRN